MSWWVGLSREELWEKVQTLTFKYVKLSTPNAEEDPSYRNPFAAAQSMNRHRHKLGFSGWNYSGGVTLSRDRFGEDEEWVDPSPVPNEYTEKARRIEANRLYRSWCSFSNAAWNDQYIAVSAAAELLVMIKHGYPPEEWNETEFMRWCEANHSAVQEQLALVD